MRTLRTDFASSKPKPITAFSRKQCHFSLVMNAENANGELDEKVERVAAENLPNKMVVRRPWRTAEKRDTKPGDEHAFLCFITTRRASMTAEKRVALFRRPALVWLALSMR